MAEEVEKLKAEVNTLKQRLSKYEGLHNNDLSLFSQDQNSSENKTLSFVVLGASGDLAKKKTYPVLFSLFLRNLLPNNFIIVGYARSPLDLGKFKEQISSSFKKASEQQKQEFLSKVFYVSGQYDKVEDFKNLDDELIKLEGASGGNRIFYYAIPPNVFIAVSKCVKAVTMSKTGWNRTVVEKPFGKDSETSDELSRELGKLFVEEQIYRIDHYLGKEMVQNLMALRFANTVFEPIWNRHYIKNVQITFKENIGTEGRGGYFDKFGIIRDVMQNHLLQIVSLVGMEPPVSLSPEHVRDEKVKLLRAIPAIKAEDVVTGQFVASKDGKNPGYLDDEGVPKDSLTPTYAMAVLHINNSRWKGIPFIVKCGKGLNERKAEIRIQFDLPPNNLFKDLDAANELVLRVQPNEAVYMKMMSKAPGLTSELNQTELDLSYKPRFDVKDLPDAYERLIYDVVRGDQGLFVRADELEAAWKIFTPILHQIDNDRVIKPEFYEFGTRGPASSDALAKKYGWSRNEDYVWKSPYEQPKL